MNSSPTTPPMYVILFLAGLTLGVLGGWALTLPSASAIPEKEERDDNNDGKPDVTYYYDTYTGYVQKAESDRDADGNADVLGAFDTQGVIASEKYDDNFDGFYETTLTYTNGDTREARTDIDKDGKTDYLSFYRHDVPYKTEMYGTAHDTPVRVNYWGLGGALESSDHDEDGDGFLEVRRHYDRYEEVVRSERNTKPD